MPLPSIPPQKGAVAHDSMGTLKRPSSLQRRMLRTVTILVTSALLAGCLLLGQPCHETPAQGTALLTGDVEAPDFRAAFAAEGWRVEPDDTTPVVLARAERDGHELRARGYPTGHGPGGAAHLEVELTRAAGVEPRNGTAARDALEPHLAPLVARLGGGTVGYSHASRHCGAV